MTKARNIVAQVQRRMSGFGTADDALVAIMLDNPTLEELADAKLYVLDQFDSSKDFVQDTLLDEFVNRPDGIPPPPQGYATWEAENREYPGRMRDETLDVLERAEAVVRRRNDQFPGDRKV